MTPNQTVNETLHVFTQRKKQQNKSNPFNVIMPTKTSKPMPTPTPIQPHSESDIQEETQPLVQTTDPVLLSLMQGTQAVTTPNQVSVLDLDPEPVRYVPCVAEKPTPRNPNEDIFTPKAFELYKKLFNEVHLISDDTECNDELDTFQSVADVTHTVIARNQLCTIYRHLSDREKHQMQPLIARRNDALAHNKPFVPSRHAKSVHMCVTKIMQTLTQLDVLM